MVTFSVVSFAIVTHADVGAGPTIVELITGIGYEVRTVSSSVPRRDIADKVAAICSRDDVELLVNAPWHPERTDLSESAQGFTTALERGLHGVFSACREAASAAMASERPLTIVNICSASGIVAVPGRLAESCTSAGLLAMTKALAAEWGPMGVRVTAVVVGPTDRWSDLGPVPGVIPLGRTVSDADIAASVAILSSDQAPGVTGSGITVDNGWLANGWRVDD